MELTGFQTRSLTRLLYQWGASTIIIAVLLYMVFGYRIRSTVRSVYIGTRYSVLLLVVMLFVLREEESARTTLLLDTVDIF